MAMAMAKSSRLQPLSVSIGIWKKPIAERGPKVRSAIRQPAAIASHGVRSALAVVVVALISSSPHRFAAITRPGASPVKPRFRDRSDHPC